MNSRASWLTVLTLAAVAAGVALVLTGDGPPADPSELRVVSLLGGDDASGYRRADPAYRPVFPQDHGPHPDFRSEWWYFTGNLTGAGGGHFGFQLTFFRFAVAPADATRASVWGTRQVWMAHLALTDVTGRRFFSDERFARDALGLTGAQAAPFRVWLEDWSASSTDDSFLPLRLVADAGEFAIDLELGRARPPVLQGTDGYSAKGPEEGNASHYYSYTRMPVTGSVRTGDASSRVGGSAWLDREWGTSALGPEVVGWDWFALQLDDGRDLMYYRLRRRDGSSDPFSAGSLVTPSGERSALQASGVEIQPRGWWKSPDSGVRYPVAWRLAIPAEGLVLDLEPWLENQEMDLSVRYWEGAMRAQGVSAGRPVSGVGYLEMTGYEP